MTTTAIAIAIAIADPRERRLPQWVQQELRRLRADLADLQRLIASTTNGAPESDTWVRDYRGPDRPLPPGCTVRFVIGPDRSPVEITARETSSRRRGVLSVTSLNGRLTVAPVVTNVIEITVDSR